jgi:hypothetical protein
MKRLAFIISLLISTFSFAQSPDLFNYQSVVRDQNGNILANQSISLKISVLQGSSSGTVVYEEDHSPTSSASGLISLQIGSGNVVSGTFSSIAWAGAAHYIKVEADPNGGSNYELLSNNQLVSVPYAIHASTVDNVDDADADTTNELQTLSLNGREILLSDGGSADLDQEFSAIELKMSSDSSTLRGLIDQNTQDIAADSDQDSLNEIQSIYDSGDTLYLSKNGGYLFFGPIITPWTKTQNGIYYDGNVSINSSNLSYPLLVADTAAHSNSSFYRNGILVASQITNSNGANYAGIYSEVEGSASTNMAVDATSLGNSGGTNYGVGGYARNAATNIGVEGFVGSSNSENVGLDVFVRSGSENYGVRSYVRANSANADENVAVIAETQANSGNARAIWAQAYGSNPGTAIYSEATGDSLNYGLRAFGIGSSGNSSNQYGVIGTARGSSSGGTGSGNFFGMVASAEGNGSFDIGISATSEGTSPNISRGVEAVSSAGTATYGQGIYSIADGNTTSSGYNAGIYSQGTNSSNQNYGGIFTTNGQGDVNYGSANYAYGTISGSKANVGSYGYASNADTNVGLYGFTENSAGLNIGVYGEATDATANLAGYFEGNVVITGSLSVTGAIAKGSGSFKIDHPADPENKYLVHSFVESPEMMNVFSGNIITDQSGEAEVELPSYFEDNNIDFRYQLTVIGEFAQAIVSEEIVGNRFKVRTNKPNVKVSWQVSAKRNDPYAKAYPIINEESKEEHLKGTYLHPELYNKPDSKRSYGKLSIPARQNFMDESAPDRILAPKTGLGSEFEKDRKLNSDKRVEKRELELEKKFRSREKAE